MMKTILISLTNDTERDTTTLYRKFDAGTYYARMNGIKILTMQKITRKVHVLYIDIKIRMLLTTRNEMYRPNTVLGKIIKH